MVQSFDFLERARQQLGDVNRCRLEVRLSSDVHVYEHALLHEGIVGVFQCALRGLKRLSARVIILACRLEILLHHYLSLRHKKY